MKMKLDKMTLLVAPKAEAAGWAEARSLRACCPPNGKAEPKGRAATAWAEALETGAEAEAEALAEGRGGWG